MAARPDEPAEPNRRSALKLLALSTASIATAAAALAAEPADAPPSAAPPAKAAAPAPRDDPRAEARARLLAGDTGLQASKDEMKRLAHDAAELKKSMQKLRDFVVADDVEPAFQFRVLEP